MSLPPLVDLGPELSPAEIERFSRHVLIPSLGQEGQRRLRAAKIAVVGVGGLGSPVCLYLAAAGVGKLGLIDDDLVEATNLQRQIIHDATTIGQAKTASGRRRIEDFTPLTKVIEHRERLTAANAEQLLASYDLVVDCSDNFTTRYAVCDATTRLNKPVIWGAIFQTHAQVSVFFKNSPGGVDLRDLFPESPAAEVLSCAEAGVLGALCGQVGSLMAIEAVKLVCGIGEPLLGRVLVLDALAATWTQVPLRPGTWQRRPPEISLPATGDQESFPVVTPKQLAKALARPQPPIILDVREPGEIELGVIPGALTIPVGAIELGQFPEIAKHEQLVVVCKIGPRSLRAARALAAAGFLNISILQGGMIAWIDEIAPSLPRY